MKTDDPRQCPICGEADQHNPECVLEGKEHVYLNDDPSRVDWAATLAKHGLLSKD